MEKELLKLLNEYVQDAEGIGGSLANFWGWLNRRSRKPKPDAEGDMELWGVKFKVSEKVEPDEWRFSGQPSDKDRLRDETTSFETTSFETICPKCGNLRTKLVGEELKCLRCSYFPLQILKVNK